MTIKILMIRSRLYLLIRLSILASRSTNVKRILLKNIKLLCTILLVQTHLKYLYEISSNRTSSVIITANSIVSMTKTVHYEMIYLIFLLYLKPYMNMI